MAFITTALRARLEARLAAKEARLEALYAAETPLDGVKEYRFDPGDASQRTEYFTPKQLGDEIDRLERQIDALNRRLNGTGVVNHVLRRKRF